jgi:hypothetical protein
MLAIGIFGVTEETASDNGEGEVVLRMQCAQFLEDSLTLAINVANDYTAVVRSEAEYWETS